MIFNGVVILSKGWITFKPNPIQYLNCRDSSWVRWESASKLIVLEKKHEVKLIDVRVFEEYFKDSNKGVSTNLILIEESCNCDLIIFVNFFSNPTVLE